MVVFDGQSRSVTGRIACETLPNGNLLITANGKDNDRLLVLLARHNQLAVEKVSLKVAGDHGYSANTGEMWATKVDDTYTVRGRLPPNEGETAPHQFEIHARCEYETRKPTPQPGIPDIGRP